MSIYRRCTLVVTGEGEHFNNAYEKSLSLFVEKGMPFVSDIVETTGGFKHFAVFDSGSPLGRDTNLFYKEKMEEMITFLKSEKCTHIDKSSDVEWVLIQYGDYKGKVLKSNCKDKL